MQKVALTLIAAIGFGAAIPALAEPVTPAPTESPEPAPSPSPTPSPTEAPAQ